MTIEDIMRERAMAEIIVQRDTMIINQHMDMTKANETIAALQKRDAESKVEKE